MKAPYKNFRSALGDFFAHGVYAAYDFVQTLGKIGHELVVFVRNGRTFLGGDDESVLLKESQGVADLVFRQARQFGKADYSDRLVLLRHLEHEYVTFDVIHLSHSPRKDLCHVPENSFVV